MEIFSNVNELNKWLAGRRSSVALGTFDGVHLGHQSVIAKAVELAKAHIESGTISVVFTFANHPFSVINPNCVPKRVGDDISRNAAMAALGVDALLAVNFTKEMASMQPEGFLELLKNSCNPAYVVTGPNFSFGQYGRGTPQLLQALAEQCGFQYHMAHAVLLDNDMVSSTRIRRLLLAGELDEVNRCLGGYFSFGGTVVDGDHRGRTLGFPTANLLIVEDRAMLPNGAYAVWAVLNGIRHPAIANIGDNPTFEGCYRRLEVHLLDFSQDIYGQELQVLFVERLREQRKFDGLEALVNQLKKDQENAKRILYSNDNM